MIIFRECDINIISCAFRFFCVCRKRESSLTNKPFHDNRNTHFVYGGFFIPV